MCRRPWPLADYQTVFARTPGSAEMPSAGRPFTDRLVTRLVTAGVLVAPILLHTGVASPEAHERPYPEWYRVPEPPARLVGQARAAGGRVIAVGTTVCGPWRRGGCRPGRAGFTDLVITPERGVRVVDGLLTGFHEPRRRTWTCSPRSPAAAADDCYAEAVAAGYRWHEFGDLNLLLP